MKKLIALAACAAAAATALCACDSRDGRINDDRTAVVSETVSSRRNDAPSASSRLQSRTSGAHSGEGVLHDTASMIGEVGEDIAQGADNIGSSVMSNIDDVTDGTDNNDNM